MAEIWYFNLGYITQITFSIYHRLIEFINSCENKLKRPLDAVNSSRCEGHSYRTIEERGKVSVIIEKLCIKMSCWLRHLYNTIKESPAATYILTKMVEVTGIYITSKLTAMTLLFDQGVTAATVWPLLHHRGTQELAKL